MKRLSQHSAYFEELFCPCLSIWQSCSFQNKERVKLDSDMFLTEHCINSAFHRVVKACNSIIL